MLADSWRKPEGMVNETSPYRRFNEILPAHQTRAESDYTWRGTDRRDEAYAFLISPSKFHIIIILMPAMRMDMSRGGRTDDIDDIAYKRLWIQIFQTVVDTIILNDSYV